MFSDLEKRILLAMYNADQTQSVYNSIHMLSEDIKSGLSDEELRQVLVGLDLRKVIEIDEIDTSCILTLTSSGIRYIKEQLL